MTFLGRVFSNILQLKNIVIYFLYRGEFMSDLSQKQVEELQDFVDACNEFINGKFILADMKISKILKAIAGSEDIYNLLAECMLNFDFESELKKCCVKNATESGSFTLPNETYKLIPVVFCLLVQIDSKRIDFNYFLKTQFPYAKGQNEEYEKFSTEVVAPFRDAIAGLFNISTAVRPKEQVEEEPSIIDRKIKEQLEAEEEENAPRQEEVKVEAVETPAPKTALDRLFDDIRTQVEYMQQLAPYIRKAERRENVVILLKGMLRVCELQDLLLLSSLMIAINELCGGEKMLRDNIKNIGRLYANFLSENR